MGIIDIFTLSKFIANFFSTDTHILKQGSLSFFMYPFKQVSGIDVTTNIY